MTNLDKRFKQCRLAENRPIDSVYSKKDKDKFLDVL